MTVMAAGGRAWADGFHNPPFQKTKPTIWEREIRKRLRLPKNTGKTQVTGEKPGITPPPKPDQPLGPGLTTEELAPVVVYLIDLLRYLDPVNINPTEFPEVSKHITAYRKIVKQLLADLGPRGAGYVVEALVQELRARRKGDGRRMPTELLGKPRANRRTFGPTGDSEVLPSPKYVGDLVDVLRLIGWDALREVLYRQATDRSEDVREDLGRVLKQTLAKWPRLFWPLFSTEKDVAIRKAALQSLVGILTTTGTFASDRALADKVVTALIEDLRSEEEPIRTAAEAGLQQLLKQSYGRDQIAWRSYWDSTVPALTMGLSGVEELIGRLAHDEPLARVTAARHLKDLCGTSCGLKSSYWAQAGEQKRAAGQVKWRAWWRENADRMLDKAEAKQGKKK